MLACLKKFFNSLLRYGKILQKSTPTYGCAHLNFKRPKDLVRFFREFNCKILTDSCGFKAKLLIDFALFQQVPDLNYAKPNPACGTYKTSQFYQQFLQKYPEFAPKSIPSPEYDLDNPDLSELSPIRTPTENEMDKVIDCGINPEPILTGPKFVELVKAEEKKNANVETPLTAYLAKKLKKGRKEQPVQPKHEPSEKDHIVPLQRNSRQEATKAKKSYQTQATKVDQSAAAQLNERTSRPAPRSSQRRQPTQIELCFGRQSSRPQEQRPSAQSAQTQLPQAQVQQRQKTTTKANAQQRNSIAQTQQSTANQVQAQAQQQQKSNSSAQPQQQKPANEAQQTSNVQVQQHQRAQPQQQKASNQAQPSTATTQPQPQSQAQPPQPAPPKTRKHPNPKPVDPNNNTQPANAKQQKANPVPQQQNQPQAPKNTPKILMRKQTSGQEASVPAAPVQAQKVPEAPTQPVKAQNKAIKKDSIKALLNSETPKPDVLNPNQPAATQPPKKTFTTAAKKQGSQ